MARETGVDQILRKWVSDVVENFRSNPASATPQAVFDKAVNRVNLATFDFVDTLLRRTRDVTITRLSGVDLLGGTTKAEEGHRRVLAAAIAVLALEQLQSAATP